MRQGVGVAGEKEEAKTVCFFFGDFSGAGGAERSAISIANGLAGNGYRVILLSLVSDNRFFFRVDERIKCVSLFDRKISIKLNIFAVLTGIRLFCKKERVAIWIDVDPIVSSISLPALAFLKVRHISWEHFNFKNALGRRMRRLGRYMAAQFADAIVVLTKQDERLWLDALNPKARISVIYNPSPFDNVFNDHSRKDGRLIISIGRLIKLKGYDLLIDAWQLIRRDCANGWSVVVIGDGPEKPFLEQKIKALGLSETFLLVGRKNDVASYYEKADLFCLSSLAEGLPMVLIEAQAYGVPCVSFNCLTGPSEIIEHGVNGLLVDCGDVVGLANALRLMMEDQDMRTRMSSASIVAKRKFNRQDIIARWCRLFAEISHDK